jgi:hypothetical protein
VATPLQNGRGLSPDEQGTLVLPHECGEFGCFKLRKAGVLPLEMQFINTPGRFRRQR